MAPGTRIAGIETPDARTLVFKLGRPSGGTLAAALVLPLTAPVPRDYALPLDRARVSEYGAKQVATGPYMVGSYEPGTTIELVRNPSWNAKTDFRPAYLDKIVMPQGNDDAAMTARRVLDGEDMVTGDYLLPPAVLKEAVTRRPDQLELVGSGGGRWAALNTKVAPFDDINVRKAVLAGFDRQATLLALGGEKVGTVATHFLPPGMPGFEQAGGVKGTGVDYLGAPGGDDAVAAVVPEEGRLRVRPLLGRADPDGRAARRQRPPDLGDRQGSVREAGLRGQAAPAVPGDRADEVLRLPGLGRRGLPERRLGA